MYNRRHNKIYRTFSDFINFRYIFHIDYSTLLIFLCKKNKHSLNKNNTACQILKYSY